MNGVDVAKKSEECLAETESDVNFLELQYVNHTMFSYKFRAENK